MDNTETKTKAIHEQPLRPPFLVTVVASIIVLAAFFLPLATADAEYAEYLKTHAQDYIMPGIEVTNEEVIHISMYEYAMMYMETYNTIDRTLSTVVVAIIGAAGFLSLITLLFAIFKKPIAVIIFNALSLGVYYLMVWDFKERGVVPNNIYNLGFAYYVYYIGFIAVFAGAVWLLGVKIKQKRQRKSETSVITENNRN